MARGKIKMAFAGMTAATNIPAFAAMTGKNIPATAGSDQSIACLTFSLRRLRSRAPPAVQPIDSKSDERMLNFSVESP
jgi:hypothetical protein